MKLEKINYTDLNARQKENYNYHKVAAVLAEYGYDCLRLNNDWQGADFIAVHNDGETYYKVQLKGRITFDKKYMGKDVWIAFVDKKTGKVCLYDHDHLLSKQPENMFKTKSWQEGAAWNDDYINKRNLEHVTLL